MSQNSERSFAFPPCVRDYDLLISLVGLNMDCSEWVKLGLMDEAERLDRHWASWANFTQARAFSIHALRSLLIFFPLVRMCAGPSALEETFAFLNKSTQNCLTSTLSSTKWSGHIFQQKLRPNLIT